MTCIAVPEAQEHSGFETPALRCVAPQKRRGKTVHFQKRHGGYKHGPN